MKDFDTLKIALNHFEDDDQWFMIKAKLNDDKKAVGFLTCALDMDSSLYISDTYVSEGHKRRGIATLMREYLLKNFSDFYIWGDTVSESGAGFYGAEGFFELTQKNRNKSVTNLKHRQPKPETHLIPKQKSLQNEMI